MLYMAPKILYEDRDLIALNKPAGLLVHGIKSHPGDDTLVDWLLKKYPEIKTVGDDPESRAGIVHRLDKETSGVMLIARNQKSFEYLKGLFQNHEIKKIYVALVWGEITKPSGIINLRMGLKSGSLKRTTRIKGTKMVKEAQTIYRVQKVYSLPEDPSQKFTLIEAEPKTGRTHQIRVHLAALGHPIVGDSVYTKRKSPAFVTRQFLHAKSIELTLPDGVKKKFSAEWPRDLNLESLSTVNPDWNN